MERTAKALELPRRDARTAGRLVAGFATVQGPVRGYQPLWEAVVGVLLAVPIESDHPETVMVTLAGGDVDRRAMAGLVAHVCLSPPAVLLAEVDDDRGRYVQLVVGDHPRPSVVVESVGDGEQIAQLQALGWHDPLDDPSDDEDLQPRNHTRIWPAPLDLDTACWHVALTLATVYGLDVEEPVLAAVGLLCDSIPQC